jgi:hypothetical protein
MIWMRGLLESHVKGFLMTGWPVIKSRTEITMSPAYLHKLFYFYNLGPVSPYFPKKKEGQQIGNRCKFSLQLFTNSLLK